MYSPHPKCRRRFRDATRANTATNNTNQSRAWNIISKRRTISARPSSRRPGPITRSCRVLVYCQVKNLLFWAPWLQSIIVNNNTNKKRSKTTPLRSKNAYIYIYICQANNKKLTHTAEYKKTRQYLNISWSYLPFPKITPPPPTTPDIQVHLTLSRKLKKKQLNKDIYWSNRACVAGS